jgi:hypothetical protein
VIFDEFQDVLATKPPLDGLLRSRLEQHETEASYVFAGSHPGMMNRLFGDQARPFYGQARAVRLEPLPPVALAAYIGESFSNTGRDIGEMIDPLLATARGHPQRAMLLAHFLWEATPRGKESDGMAWQETLHHVYLELRDEFNSIWDGRNDAERRTLVAIAAAPDTLSKGVLEELQLPRSTARDARDRLISDGYVQGTGDDLEVVDPLLAIWVLSGRQGLTESTRESEQY